MVPGGLFLSGQGLNGVLGGAPKSLLLPTTVEDAMDGGREDDLEATEATSSLLLKLLLPLLRRWKLRTREEAGDAIAETAGEQPTRHDGDAAEGVFRLNRPVVSGGGISLLSLFVRIPPCGVPGTAPAAATAGVTDVAVE